MTKNDPASKVWNKVSINRYIYQIAYISYSDILVIMLKLKKGTV